MFFAASSSSSFLLTRDVHGSAHTHAFERSHSYIHTYVRTYECLLTYPHMTKKKQERRGRATTVEGVGKKRLDSFACPPFVMCVCVCVCCASSYAQCNLSLSIYLGRIGEEKTLIMSARGFGLYANSFMQNTPSVDN